MKHECESCIHLLKDKYQSERRKVMQNKTSSSSLEELYQECGAIFKPLPGLSVIQQQMKDKSHFLRYCKLSDQFFDARDKINEEIKMTDSLIVQSGRSSRIKASLPGVREIKDVMDKALNEQRSLIKQDLCNPNFFSSKEAILAEVETELQKATIEWISYVDPESRDMNSWSKKTAADTETVLEEGSANLNLSANAQTDHDGRKRSAVEKMDQSLKLLKSLNDLILRDESSKYERDSTNYDAPADESRELKQSTSKFLSTIKSAASEPAKYQQSNAPMPVRNFHDLVNDVDWRIERNCWSKSLKWQLRKKERDLELKRKQRQLEWEMEMKLEELQAETELADLRDQTSLKMQEMKLQIEEAEVSCHGSTISHSLMSLSIDEDKGSSIKNWLDQNSGVMDFQNRKSQNVENAEKGKPAISSNAIASRCRGQPLKVIERKDASAERKTGRLSDRGDRSQSRSK